jgi:hypothetical protein
MANLVVVVLAPKGPTSTTRHADRPVRRAQAAVPTWCGNRHFAIQSDSKLGEVLMTGNLQRQAVHRPGRARRCKNPLAIRVPHNGTTIEALVLLPRAAELLRLMPTRHRPT